MDLFNFGRAQLENGSLNGMLADVGVDDVGSFVNQFRGTAQNRSGGSGNNTGDMIQGAMNAYQMFSGSGGQGNSGGFFGNFNSTVQNAQQMYAMYQKFDRNGDGKIMTDDVEIVLKEMGLGAASPFLAKALFQAVDQNRNGHLDFTDLMALVTLLNKLAAQYGVAAP